MPKKKKTKLEKVMDLARNGFLCEVVTDGWANWSFSEFGTPLINTAIPIYNSKNTKFVGFRGCFWFFDKTGKLVHDDIGMFETFEMALDALFEKYENLKYEIDIDAFKTYKK